MICTRLSHTLLSSGLSTEFSTSRGAARSVCYFIAQTMAVCLLSLSATRFTVRSSRGAARIIIKSSTHRGHIDSQQVYAVFLSNINSLVRFDQGSVQSPLLMSIVQCSLPMQPPEWVIVIQRGAGRGGRGAGLLDTRVLKGKTHLST